MQWWQTKADVQTQGYKKSPYFLAAFPFVFSKKERLKALTKVGCFKTNNKA